MTGTYKRELSFVKNRFHKEQHTYQEGKYAEKTLAVIVTKIEKFIKKGNALNVLLDIEGAFYFISVESIFQYGMEDEVSNTVETWMPYLLDGR